MKKQIRKLIALVIAIACLAAAPAGAYADNDEAGGAEGIINDKELTAIIEGYMGEHNINRDNFSVGFCYTATGDTWYYNGDTWFYPASVYKIPLIMLLSEKVAAGELSQEDKIQGLEVSTIEEYILTYSNNDWAHNIRTYLGGDEVWRQEAKKYATLKDEEYDPDYMEYCYFSNRYITEVLKTLYYESVRFPNVIDCMLAAEHTHYFRLSMENMYDIAQKYGSYEDSFGRKFNHTVGIVYTENPCIISVMTCNVDGYEKVISDVARLVTEYSVSLDNKLSAYREERKAAEEEEKRIAAEKAAEEAKRLENEARLKAESEKKQQVIETQTEIQTARKSFWLQTVVLVVVTVLIISVAGVIIRSRKHRKRAKRYEQYRKRYEAEQRAVQGTGRSRKRSGKYTPKH